ncbi:hypothetical protein SAMN05518672_101360 [Chitinophaga sp. CF118]|uniref:hypothetical protein n=1 Tax=Chitinophaga sp. CF118 TaxID=1884367 RepID=UPI0008E80631|nr:hypothetical protein [Chitinophaga sp. CF118]SFD07841.1 hypothetical protein SAMN05518672_101360 [Chitinophaga sp. CF118]
MKLFIRCAVLTLFWFVYLFFNMANAQARKDTTSRIYKSKTTEDVVISFNSFSKTITITSLQEVIATAFQDACTISMEDNSLAGDSIAKSSVSKEILPSYIRQIKIYDAADVLRKTFNYVDSSNTQVNIDISDLSAGSYLIETITSLKSINKQKVNIAR